MGETTGSPTAAILVIGDEVLSGKVEEQNARFLVRELRSLGVAVRRIEVIPDAREAIAASVRSAHMSFDHVFTAGGIGPTHDDVTVAAVAQAFAVPVVRDEELAGLIRSASGDRLHPRDLRMADVPEGARLVRGGARWPVVAMDNVYLLPGVPSILQRQFTAIRDRFQAPPFFSRAIYSAESEGAIAHVLDQAVADFPSLAIGSYPHVEACDHKVMITIDGRDASTVDAACEQIVTALGAAVVRVA